MKPGSYSLRMQGVEPKSADENYSLRICDLKICDLKICDLKICDLTIRNEV